MLSTRLGIPNRPANIGSNSEDGDTNPALSHGRSGSGAKQYRDDKTVHPRSPAARKTRLAFNILIIGRLRSNLVLRRGYPSATMSRAERRIMQTPMIFLNEGYSPRGQPMIQQSGMRRIDESTSPARAPSADARTATAPSPAFANRWAGRTETTSSAGIPT